MLWPRHARDPWPSHRHDLPGADERARSGVYGGHQIAETLRVHTGVGKEEARARTLDMLRRVGIASPERRIDDYPHQLSGGMRQR